MPQPRLILASASPRRQELLREAGFCFEVRPADIDESVFPPGLAPGGLATYLAERKARAVASHFGQAVVLAADTVVALDSQIFGKPADRNDARNMLTRLSGTTHAVLTGIAVVQPATGHSRSRLVESSVQMRPLSASEIETYLDTNNWQGKAGSYGIQDPDPFVTRITGSLTNIVGLPMDEAQELLAAAGVVPAWSVKT
jgi:septum formation protein